MRSAGGFGMRIALVCLSILLLSGCLVRTAANIVTMPVKAVSAGVDAVTTSQSEKDEKRGRALRKQDEERGKQLRMAAERCRNGRPLPADDCAAAAQR